MFSPYAVVVVLTIVWTELGSFGTLSSVSIELAGLQGRVTSPRYDDFRLSSTVLTFSGAVPLVSDSHRSRDPDRAALRNITAQ